MFKTLKTNNKKSNYFKINSNDILSLESNDSKLKTISKEHYYQKRKTKSQTQPILDKVFIDLEIKTNKIESNAKAGINWYGTELSEVSIYDINSASNQRAAMIIKDSFNKSIVLVDPSNDKEIFSYNFYSQVDNSKVKYDFYEKQADHIETMKLFSFGGFYKPGISIDAIEQVFIQLIQSSNNKVTIYPSKRSFWETSGCPMDGIGLFKQNKIIFPDFYAKGYTPTLAQSIRSGGIKIKSTEITQYNIMNNNLIKDNDIIEEIPLESYDFIMLSANKIRIMLRHC